MVGELGDGEDEDQVEEELQRRDRLPLNGLRRRGHRIRLAGAGRRCRHASSGAWTADWSRVAAQLARSLRPSWEADPGSAPYTTSDSPGRPARPAPHRSARGPQGEAAACGRSVLAHVVGRPPAAATWLQGRQLPDQVLQRPVMGLRPASVRRLATRSLATPSQSGKELTGPAEEQEAGDVGGRTGSRYSSSRGRSRASWRPGCPRGRCTSAGTSVIASRMRCTPGRTR